MIHSLQVHRRLQSGSIGQGCAWDNAQALIVDWLSRLKLIGDGGDEVDAQPQPTHVEG